MRNMKRFLSLALALVMVFSLVISASAKSIDEFADINPDVDANDAMNDYLDDGDYFRDSLQMAVDLSILKGDNNNNLNPQGSVTRAEFVTMLYKFMHGGAEIAGVWTNTAFADIVGHWGEKYIAWAYGQGLISGTKAPTNATSKDGVFSPNGTISYTQALRMTLSALGINGTYEGIDAYNWANKTLVIATEGDINIVRDFNAANNATLTRVECAVILNFALEAAMQEYTMQYNGSGMTYTRKSAERSNDLLLAGVKYYDYTRVSGTVAANDIAAVSGAVAASGKIRMTSVVAGTFTGSQTYSIDLPVEAIGRDVYFYAKINQTTGAASKIYGSVNYTDKMDTYSVGGLTVSGTTLVNGDGDTVANNATTGTYVNYAIGTDATTVRNTFAAAKADNNVRLIFKNGATVATYAFFEDLTFTQISKVSGGKVTAKAVMTTATETKYIETKDTLAANDYVTIAPVGSVYLINKATTLKAQVSRTRDAGATFVINGTNYSNYAITGLTAFDPAGNLAKDFTFYVFGTKIAKAVSASSEVAEATQYCYVEKFVVDSSVMGDTSDVVTARVWSLKDPKGKGYVVSEDSTGYAAMANKTTTTGYFSYTIDGDGLIVLDTAASTTSSAATQTVPAYNGTSSMIKLPIGSTNTKEFYIAANTAFFLTDSSDAVVGVRNKPVKYAVSSALAVDKVKTLASTAAADQVSGLDVLYYAVMPSFDAASNFQYVFATDHGSYNSDKTVTFSAFDGTVVKDYVSVADVKINGTKATATTNLKFKNQIIKLDNATGEIVDIIWGATNAYTSKTTTTYMSSESTGYFKGRVLGVSGGIIGLGNDGTATDTIFRSEFSKVKLYVIQGTDCAEITDLADFTMDTDNNTYTAYFNWNNSDATVTDIWVLVAAK